MSAGFDEHPAAPGQPDDRDPRTGARPADVVHREIVDAWAVEVAEAAQNAAMGQASAAAFLGHTGTGGVDVTEPGPA